MKEEKLIEIIDKVADLIKELLTEILDVESEDDESE